VFTRTYKTILFLYIQYALNHYQDGIANYRSFMVMVLLRLRH